MVKPLEAALRTLSPPADHMLMPLDNQTYSVQLPTISPMKIASRDTCDYYMQVNIARVSPAHFKIFLPLYTENQ